MKALVLEKIGTLRVQDVELPAPDEDEVRIRVAATGICGSDVHGFTGENGRRFPGQVMGHESSGIIDAVGSDVSEFRVGEKVTFNPVVIPLEDTREFLGREQRHPSKTVIGVAPSYVSAFAEYLVVPSRNVVKLSDSMPLEIGALVEPLAVAVHAVRQSGASSEDSVLVIGGGPIGQSVVIALQMHGIKNIALSELQPSRRELVESLGAKLVDPTADDFAEGVAKVLGARPAVVIDAVGLTITLNSALQACREGGTICLVGMGAPEVQIPAYQVSTEERTLVGSFTYSAKDFSDAADWVGENFERLLPLVSEIVSIDQAEQKFSELASGADIPGKVLVRFFDEEDEYEA
jgi:L-iditol 2-dehydrogenase